MPRPTPRAASASGSGGCMASRSVAAVLLPLLLLLQAAALARLSGYSAESAPGPEASLDSGAGDVGATSLPRWRPAERHG